MAAESISSETGPPQERQVLTRREKLFAGSLLLLVLIMGAGALLSGYMQNSSWQRQFTQSQEQQQEARQKQNEQFGKQLCAIFLPIAALKAPTGDASNPSRLFEQQLEAKLALIAPLLRCEK